MFTGLIEAICKVKSARHSAGTVELTVDLDKLADESKIGDSVAINGACLTICRLDGSSAIFEVSAETLAKSNLGRLTASSKVNVELAIRVGERLGGHIVQGHIDGTATVKTINRLGQFADIEFTADQGLLDQMVVKGSVAVDGISLTIASMDQECFSVAIIPETLNKTTLGMAKVGDVVNIETDIVVKIIKKQLESILPPKQKLTVEKLKQLGF